MNERVYCNELYKYVGTQVCIEGWVHKVRDLGAISFIIVRDRTGFVQVVSDTVACKVESVVRMTGTVLENEKAPEGVELQLQDMKLFSEPADELPISVSLEYEKYGLEVLLNQRHLSLRNPKLRSIFEVQSEIIYAFSQCLREKGFYEIKTSKIINSGTEGGTGLFEVQYFNTTVFLSQSPQFYKQAAVATGLEKVFEVGAAYRAEKHETNRHLNEYVSLDLEIGFIESLDVLFSIERDIMSFIAERLLSACATQIQLWDVTIPSPESFQKAPALSYDEVKEIASQQVGKKLMEIDGIAEKAISDWAKKEHGIAAVFIYGYPRRKRPFYTMPDDAKTKSFDFIFNGVELTSGGLRIHDYAMLLENVKRFGMDANTLQDYLSIFKYGCPPHGGLAIGLERLTQKFLNIDTVKLASMFPRDRNRVSP